MKTALQKIILAGSVALLPLVASAAPVIPKLDLATCEIRKADLLDWFSTYRDEDKAALETVRDPMTLTVQQVNLAGNPGFSDYFKVSIRGVDANGNSVPNVMRTLEQLAVNYGDRVISVGYAPYDVSRTSAAPFSLMIESGSSDGQATGYMSFVPLQATAREPMKQLELGCRIHKMPAEPVTIGRSEVAALAKSAQFELLYNLDRLGHSTYLRRNDTISEYGLSAETLEKVRKEVSAMLSARPIPPLPSWVKPKSVIITEGDRCGDLELGNITPVFDSLTIRELRTTGSPALKAKAIGFVIRSAHCSVPARRVERAGHNDKTHWSDDNWNVRDIVITPDGLIENYSFKATTFNLW